MTGQPTDREIEGRTPDHGAAELRQGTRWGRAGLLALASFGVLGWIVGQAASGALAVQLNVDSQSSPAAFSTTLLEGPDIAFGAAAGSVDGSTTPVLRAGVSDATLNGFCLSQTQSLGVLGDITVKVTAGDDSGKADITANYATFDLTTIRAAGEGVVLGGWNQIGVASTDVTTIDQNGAPYPNPLDAPTTGYGEGWFGIDSDQGAVHNIKGRLYSAQVIGNITLPHLKVNLFHASKTGDAAPCDAAGETPED
ncbi:MAG: DUF6230 family protein [Nocardioides sp.]|uniref:DUF6230 family protein n=1 Tax=Nocardioides sp. TaxID=35761 RepID=UPI0039E2B8FF